MTINFLAVLVAAVAAFVIGFLWHGPVFGKQWMKLMNISKKDMEGVKGSDMIPQMIAAFVQSVVMAFVLALFASAFGVAGALDAIMLAFWAWLGFIVTTQLNGVLWEKRSINLYLFGITYQFVNMVAISLIVGLWR